MKLRVIVLPVLLFVASTNAETNPWSIAPDSQVATHSLTGLTFPARVRGFARSPIGPSQNPYNPGTVGVSYGEANQPVILVVLAPEKEGVVTPPANFVAARVQILAAQFPTSAATGKGNVSMFCNGASTQFAFATVRLPTGPALLCATNWKDFLIFIHLRGITDPQDAEVQLRRLVQELGWPCEKISA